MSRSRPLVVWIGFPELQFLSGYFSERTDRSGGLALLPVASRNSSLFSAVPEQDLEASGARRDGNLELAFGGPKVGPRL